MTGLPFYKGDSTTPLWRTAARKIGRRLLAWRFRHFDLDNEPERDAKVAGLKLRVLPNVFNPSLHFTSSFFARSLKNSGIITSTTTVLDIGTGSGILAISAALAGAKSVTAIDINPAAVQSAKLNAKRHGVDSKLLVLEGDMFDPVGNARFDLVVCNPPYLRGEPKSLAGYAYWGGHGLEWLTRFGKELHNHLHKSGSCIISIGDAADIAAIVENLSTCGWQVKEVARRDILFEIIYLFRLTELPDHSVVDNHASRQV